MSTVFCQSTGVQNLQLNNPRFLSTTQAGKAYLKSTVQEIMFQFAYPRLDVEVTKGVNHLLKSPFCVHPKTGRVCVPMDVDKINEFDPFAVPTVQELCTQINKFDASNPNAVKSSGKKLQDYKKTAMKDFMAPFTKFLEPLESAIRDARLIMMGKVGCCVLGGLGFGSLSFCLFVSCAYPWNR